MLSLLPYHQPTYGLSFSRQSVSLVKKHPHWLRKPPIPQESYEHALPVGVLFPTYESGNILDSTQLIRELRQIRNSSTTTTIALTLPDLCAQVDILEFDTFPQRHEEQEEFLKWRFQELSPIPLGEQVIVFQHLPSSHRPLRGNEKTQTEQRVLAASIRKNILLEYEKVCEEAGFIPIKIGLSAIEIFNFCQSSFRWENECFFACLGKESFTFFAFQFGTLSFLRMKAMNQHPRSLIQELRRTLQIYNLSHPHHSSKATPSISPLYYLSDYDIQWNGLPSLASQDNEGLVLFPADDESWAVQPHAFIDNCFSKVSPDQKIKEQSIVTLSAWAGLY